VPQRVLGLDVDPDDAAAGRERRRRRRGSLVPPPLPSSSVDRHPGSEGGKLVQRHQGEKAVEGLRSAEGVRLGLPRPQGADLAQRKVGGEDSFRENDAVDDFVSSFGGKLRGRVGGAGEVCVVAAEEVAVPGEDGVALDEVGALELRVCVCGGGEVGRGRRG